MIKIREEELTGIKEVDEYLTKVINERLIKMVTDEIVIFTEDYGHKYSILRMVFFPEGYPEDRCMNKMIELREKLVSREYQELDTFCKYGLFEILSLECISMEDFYGTTIDKISHRDSVARELFDKYGTLKDKKKYINYYEDYKNYSNMIFEDYDFFDIEQLPTEKLLEIEERESKVN